MQRAGIAGLPGPAKVNSDDASRANDKDGVDKERISTD